MNSDTRKKIMRLIENDDVNDQEFKIFLDALKQCRRKTKSEDCE